MHRENTPFFFQKIAFFCFDSQEFRVLGWELDNPYLLGGGLGGGFRDEDA